MAMFSDEELIMIAIALDDEHETEVKRKWVQEAWKSRDSEGEFALLFKELVDDGTKFFQYFKMSEGTFNLLLSKLAVHLKKQDTRCRKAITPEERLAVCLRFLAAGDSYQAISGRYRMGLSTVYSIVTKTCKVICDNLMSTILPKPTENMWKSVANDFYEKWNFPNCLGALDAKSIKTQPTSNSGSETYSVVLLSLVDAHHNFIAVDVGAYGKKRDGEFFKNSNLLKAFEEGTLSIPGNAALPKTSTEAPYVIIADGSFPLRTYLMRPYPTENLDNSKRVYNYRLGRVRKVVEETFEKLFQKFQIYNKKIQAAPYNIDNIVLTTCILYNFIKKYDENTYTYETHEGNEVAEETLEDLPLREGSAAEDASSVREAFKHYFNSVVGCVPFTTEQCNQKISS